MKKEISNYSLVVILVLILLGIAISYVFVRNNKNNSLNETEGVEIVTTMQDKLTADSVWCPTFQLIWNDLKNELVKGNIVFDPQPEVVTNLNKEEFTLDDISDNYIYKKWGLKTLELKKEIETKIKEKFNETSEILNGFDCSENALSKDDHLRYFLYAMLRRNFEFNNPFDILEDKEINNKTIEYFGIEKDSDEKLAKQVKVLFYENYNNFAITLTTKDNDEVILYKEKSGQTFKEIYDNLITKTNAYQEEKTFQEKDTLRIPNLIVNIKKRITEVEQKKFFIGSNEAVIAQAVQLIKFELDSKGGKLKSEAGMDIDTTAIQGVRNFVLDDTFTLFLKEKNRDLPYFALRMENITKFQ